MRVALVHDWLVTVRGGERVLDALCELLPEAELFTLIHRPGLELPQGRGRPWRTSFLQRVPGIFERYRYFLPLLPAAIESFDLSGYDLVVSSSHCVAKGVRAKGPHLSYVHAPMRYVWDRYDDYFGPGRARWPLRAAAFAARPALQRWDRASAGRVTRFVANSAHIARQIRTLYDRPASVVHPFVDLERFGAGSLEGTGRGGYFLWVGALAPYKRVDVAVEAFRGLPASLWIAGGGQAAGALRHLPPNVKWLGPVPDAELPRLYREARALVFPGHEDFGITPLEAQAAGRPVIAYAAGGALETVAPDTGLLFDAQTAPSLRAAVVAFDAWEERFQPARARAQAARFTRAAFLEAMRREIEGALGKSPSTMNH